MKYLSVCSGIEAATMAWRPLGWEAVAYSEIENFPCAVLAHHYPDTPNWGDMTKFREWPDAAIDVLVGGTPCQSFSVAGLRAGMDDPRGNLALVYLAIAERYRPRWFVWENVPGVFSSGGGEDFRSFLSAAAGWDIPLPAGGWKNAGIVTAAPGCRGLAWRVLDAQYFGLAQRRKRVFVVGYLGDWRPAAAVLFEPESLRRDPAPRRETGERTARSLRGRANTSHRDDSDTYIPDISPALKSRDYKGPSSDGDGDGAPIITHALKGEGFDASEDGTGRGTPIVPVAFDLRGRDGGAQFEGPHETANIRAASGGSSRSYIAQPMAVRRLTPRECERLQGAADDYTAIPWRNHDADHCPDGPRYKALGNSKAVPVVRWIGRRMAAVDEILAAAAP